MEKSLRTLITEYMAENVQMTIATSHKDQPWVAVVFYAYDDDFNLYFLSDHRTRHSIEMDGNSKVAVTINKEWPEPAPVVGIQIEGTAQVVSLTEIPHAFAIYLKRFPGTKEFISDVKMFFDKAFNTRMYKAIPSRIFYLDEVNFGTGQRRVLHLPSGKEMEANLPG